MTIIQWMGFLQHVRLIVTCRVEFWREWWAVHEKLLTTSEDSEWVRGLRGEWLVWVRGRGLGWLVMGVEWKALLLLIVVIHGNILLLLLRLTLSSKDDIALKWIEQLCIKSIVIVKGNILSKLNGPDQGIWELFLYLTEASFVVVIVIGIANILILNIVSIIPFIIHKTILPPPLLNVITPDILITTYTPLWRL